MFALVSIPLILLVLSSLDLHKRRKCCLSPKRIIAVASITFVLLIVSLGLLGSCYFHLSSIVEAHCPTDLRNMWADWYYDAIKTDLAPILPFLASFSMIL